MRELADSGRLRRLMAALGREAEGPGRVYLVGGATAVLEGWRATTLDVDLKLMPESDALLRGIQRLKDELQINVERASRDHFIPPLPGWQERSPHVATEGKLPFHHYDFYSQALAKIERGHAQDSQDVSEMLRRGLIEPHELRRHYAAIEPELFRYPSLDAATFREAVERAARSRGA
jgi:hypothetical protein